MASAPSASVASAASSAPVVSGASASSAVTVESQVGSARWVLKRCSSSNVCLLIVIQALFGKCTSTASRQTLTGSR